MPTDACPLVAVGMVGSHSMVGTETTTDPRWARTRCAAGHLAERPGIVEARDLTECWCGAPRVAATCYRVNPEASNAAARWDRVGDLR
jgi:hypothetical protein